MTFAQSSLAFVRLLAVAIPLIVAAHRVRRVLPAGLPSSLVSLLGTVAAVSLLLLEAEVLGLAGLLHSGPLIALAILVALAIYAATARRRAAPASRDNTNRANTPAADPATLITLAAATTIVIGQWALASANSLGGGMFNFDTLWYHMPFAAGFAQSASITAIHFTQADPYTAYYPANSELVHAVGIALMHGDLLSPLINLGWLAIFLLASWCAGLPWRLQHRTLLAGVLIAGLPVLSTNQPGEAYNDIPGLAMLVAAVALLVNARQRAAVEPQDNAEGRAPMLVAAGLALGFSVGVKYTFLVPAFVLLVGAPLLDAIETRARLRTLLLVGAPLLLTGGWWYLRNLIHTGNPFGVRLHVGPLTLPGPISPLAEAQSQTVLSELKHTSLWISRFAPGLAHVLGPLWPLVLVALAAAIVGGLLHRGRRVRMLTVAAGASSIAYLVFPTGAFNLEQGTSLFEVNLRYATPALALALFVLPVIIQARRPKALVLFGPVVLAVLVAAQFEHPLWPAQPARHAAFLVGTAIVIGAAVLFGARRWTDDHRRSAGRPAHTPYAVPVAAALLVLLLGNGAAYALQRHYYARRYLVGTAPLPGLKQLYVWAQHVAHQRIALYGALAQYPLYGAFVTNSVTYLGEPAPRGGFHVITTCRRWRTIVNRGRFDYLVLTPIIQTGEVPPNWTLGDPAAKVVLHPVSDTWVFRLSGPLAADRCA